MINNKDIIEVREKSKKLAYIDISLQNKEREIPEYIQSDNKNKTVKLIRVPKFSEVPYPVIMEPSLVIDIIQDKSRDLHCYLYLLNENFPFYK